MRLKLLTPTEVVIDQPVTKIVAEGAQGSFCLLPRHVDYLAAIVPGLLAFEEEQTGREQFAAVDEGILVKQGGEVLISVRQASRGSDLKELRRIAHEDFMAIDERERVAQSATAKLEASFLRSYLKLVEDYP